LFSQETLTKTLFIPACGIIYWGQVWVKVLH
jgi:hypothetical protein